MRTILLILAIAVLSGSPLGAQTHLQVDNPAWWGLDRQKADLESAELVVRPTGIYTEIELTLVIGTDAPMYAPDTWIEAIMDLALPVHSIVHDSYLLIEDSLCRADILDRWTAEATYDEIVNRQRDPSILTKEAEGQFTLRVYPLPAGSTRTVKMHYLVPIDWRSQTAATELPIELFRSAADPNFPVSIRAEIPAPFQNPRLGEDELITFTPIGSAEGYDRFELNTTAAELRYDQHLVVDLQAANRLMLSVSPEEQVYQLAYYPPSWPQADQPVDLVLAINFQEGFSSNLTQRDLIDLIRWQLKRHLGPTDRFNITFGYGKQLFADWVPATDTDIDQAMGKLGSEVLHTPEADPLNPLIAAINFAQLQSDRAQIALLNNVDYFNDPRSQGSLLTALGALLASEPVPIHGWDFQSENLPFEWQRGDLQRSFTMYRNLTVLTNGFFDGTGSLVSRFDRMMRQIRRSEADLELFVQPNDGFGLQQYRINNPGTHAPANSPLMVVGQFTGKASEGFTINALVLGDSVLTERYTIGPDQILYADTMLREVWYGQVLREAERESDQDWAIADVLAISKRERVLSLHTAFLCLEPGLEPCVNCQEDQVVISTESVEAEAFQVTISPNPFADRLSVQIDWKAAPDRASVRLINAVGAVLQQRTLDTPAAGTTSTIEWTTADGLPTEAGIYWIIIEADEWRRAVPVVLQS